MIEHEIEQALDAHQLVARDVEEALQELRIVAALRQKLQEGLHRHQGVSHFVHDLGDQPAECGEPIEAAHVGVESRESRAGDGAQQRSFEASRGGVERGERARSPERLGCAAEQQHRRRRAPDDGATGTAAV